MAHSGIDTSFIEHSIRPQDDLFRHINGQWLATHEIPADRASDGAIYALRDESEKNVREIIESDTGKAGFKLRVRVFEVAGLPVAQVNEEVTVA